MKSHWWQVATFNKMQAKWQFINAVLFIISLPWPALPYSYYLFSPAPIQQRENTHGQGHRPGSSMNEPTNSTTSKEWTSSSNTSSMNEFIETLRSLVLLCTCQCLYVGIPDLLGHADLIAGRGSRCGLEPPREHVGLFPGPLTLHHWFCQIIHTHFGFNM